MLNRANEDSQFEEAVRRALLSFRCDQDKDVELFLQSKAIEFLNRRLCTIFLLFDENRFESGQLVIEGFFTLSHKVLATSDLCVSKSMIKSAAGFKDISAIHFVLIGQLGKWVIKNEDGSFSRSQITGKEILDEAFDVICSASELIPCRCVLVECGNYAKVQQVYTDYGFRFFQNDGEHNQYIKLL